MELFSPGHLVVLAILVAVLFLGWKQLPDMARSLGRSMRIFRTEIKGMGQDDAARAAAEQPTPPALQSPPVAPAPPVQPGPAVPPAPGASPAGASAPVSPSPVRPAPPVTPTIWQPAGQPRNDSPQSASDGAAPRS